MVEQARTVGATSGLHRRGCLLGVVVALALCIAILGFGWRYIDRTYRVPIIPPYPNAVGNTHYPNRLEMALLGEAFGGFQTHDTHEMVQVYYRAALAARGWEGEWYRDRDGYCYALLIIENDPRQAGVPSGTTSIAFKLRYAFDVELGKNAPPGCK